MTFQCVALTSFLSAYHGVEVDILEDESFKKMFSARLTSRNRSSNSVLSKDLLFL